MFFRRKKSALKTQLSSYHYSSSKKSRYKTIADYSFDSFDQKEDMNPESKRKQLLSHIKKISNFSESQRYRVKQNKFQIKSANKFQKSIFESNHFEIQSKMSSEAHGNIRAYGISTYKGSTNLHNPHYVGIHLGVFKNFMLIESIQGNMAAKYIKTKFPIKLLEFHGNHPKSQMMHNIGEVLKNIQDQLVKEQISYKNNSGALLAAVIMKDNQLTITNIGSSYVLIQNRRQAVKEISTDHRTSNEQQVRRLVQNGVKIYQSKILTPFEMKPEEENPPLKIAPSGLVYTRILGKAYEYKKQKQFYGQKQGLSSQPAIVKVGSEDVAWLGIFSENIKKASSMSWISQTIKDEFSKKTRQYTDHHIAMECSFKIVNAAAKKFPEEASSAIIILTRSPEIHIVKPQTHYLKSSRIKNQSQEMALSRVKPRPVSLKYAGNRRSFIKNHDSVEPKTRNNLSVKKSYKLFS